MESALYSDSVRGFKDLKFLKTNRNFTIDYWQVNPDTLSFEMIL